MRKINRFDMYNLAIDTFSLNTLHIRAAQYSTFCMAFFSKLFTYIMVNFYNIKNLLTKHILQGKPKFDMLRLFLVLVSTMEDI